MKNLDLQSIENMREELEQRFILLYDEESDFTMSVEEYIRYGIMLEGFEENVGR